jgi:hypothetical protein
VKLELIRVVLTPRCTVSVLRIDGVHACFMLEDTARAPGVKVPRQTAIPEGKYRVEITHSPRFGVDMPLVMDVPGFSGIRIHAGNTKDDTEGCLLPGRHVLLLNAGEYQVTESRAAYVDLFAQLDAARRRSESVDLVVSHV